MQKIALSAGELSGDEHAAALVKAMQARCPQLEFRGMGGSTMRQAGVKTVVDSEASASVMGFQEVLFSIRSLLAAGKTMKDLLRHWRPDLLVLVDYPDFNLRLARTAHALGIQVLYFITPQVWAWRSHRVKQIQELIDRAAVIFPFERPFFESRGFVKSVYVGHPFSDRLVREKDQTREQAWRTHYLTSLGLRSDQPVLAVFPGSRPSEIKRLLAPSLSALGLLAAARPAVQVLLSIAPPVEGLVRQQLAALAVPITPVSGQSLSVLRAADAALLKSGTSNLQAAFYGVPCSMVYSAPLLTEFVVKNWVRLQQYSMVNVIRPNTIRELLQAEIRPDNLAAEMESLLFDEQRRIQLRTGLAEVVARLGTFDQLSIFEGCTNTYERVAALALDPGRRC